MADNDRVEGPGIGQAETFSAPGRAARLFGVVAVVIGLAVIVPVAWVLFVQTMGPDDGTVVVLSRSAAVRTPAGIGYRLQAGERGSGLRGGDVVLAVDGVAVTGSSPVSRRTGDRLDYRVWRGGSVVDVPVVLHPVSWRYRLLHVWGVYLLPALLLPLGAYVFARRPKERAAQLMLMAGSFFVIGTVSSPVGPRVVDLAGGRGTGVFVISELANAALWAVLWHFTLIFPEPSRLVARRPWAVAGVYVVSLALCIGDLLWIIRGGASSPVVRMAVVDLSGPAAQVIPPVLVIGLLLAYRRSADRATRQRMRWVVLSLAGASLAYSTLGQVAQTVLGSPVVPYMWLEALFIGCPIAIAAAILAHNLFELELIVKRSLIYVVLATPLVAVYVVSLTLLSQALPKHSLFLALIAGGVGALAFRPVHDRVQRAVSRLVYGARDSPYEVLSWINRAVEDVSPSQVLQQLTEALVASLRLSYAAINLTGEDGQTDMLASTGVPRAELQVLPLTHQDRPVGHLFLAVAAGREPFGRSDRQLLIDLTSHVARVTDVVLLNAALQRSRERLVTAREEERRRLQQDLHDGIGPSLALQAMQLELTREMVRSDPDAAEEVLARIGRNTQDVVAEIRRVVEDLRPRVLGQLGLRSALEERARGFCTEREGGLRVMVTTSGDLGELSAATEVAAYRIATEALTNVVRHAQAAECRITLSMQQDSLVVSVRDDGIGMTSNERPGVGLWSMRERASELGGQFRVDSAPTIGTHVHASLPVHRRSSLV